MPPGEAYPGEDAELARREAIAFTLPEAVQLHLAIIKDAPPGIAESTIALFGREEKVLLQEQGIVEAGDEKPSPFTITPRGHGVIDICSQIVPPRPELSPEETARIREETDQTVARAIKELEQTDQ